MEPMNTITPAVNWRDLCDQLTPKQLTQIEQWDKDPSDEMREFAEDFARENALQAQHGDTPEPAGAARVHMWRDDDGDGSTRYFTASSWVIDRDDHQDGLEVDISGLHTPDGRVRRWVAIGSEYELTPRQARQLSQVLAAAADEMDARSA
jgi:hypothetical protein